MAIPLSSSKISLSICKPLNGLEIEAIMPQITKAIQTLADKDDGFKAAILKGVHASWVAVLCVLNAPSNGQQADSNDIYTTNLSSSAELARDLENVAKMVHCGCFQLSSESHRDGLSCELSRMRAGNIVSVRRIFYSDSRKRELLAYSCLALMKSYFPQTKGIISSTFYEPIDISNRNNDIRTMILGLGLWENLESACSFVNEENFSRAEVCWRDMEVEVLRFEVCKVVYVTS